jgi:hypothetical protein
VQNRLPAIIGGVVSLLFTGLCCLSGIGIMAFQRYQAQSRVQQFNEPYPPPSTPPSTPPFAPPSGPAPVAVTQLITGQRSSNYGNAVLSQGVNPAPVAIVSGATSTSSVSFSELGLRAANSGSCRGYGTAQPDYILDVQATLATLNLNVTSDGDPTLVVHHAGQYWCSDDDGDGLNPAIQLTNVEAGQYDVWVGSYSASQNINTSLVITQ